MEFFVKSSSPIETLKISKLFAKFLSKGNIIVLTGDLGAGKTKFVEGILSYFNLQDEISSPTFNIVNEYNANNINIFHFDVYRLEDASEFYEIGGEEYFSKGICLLEWGETIQNILPSSYIQITIQKTETDENCRIFNFKSIGNSDIYNNVLNNFKEALN